MSLLHNLIEANKVPFYLDYRTGSARSLCGLSTAEPTITNTPKFKTTGNGIGVDFTNGSLKHAHASDQIVTQFTWVFLLQLNPQATTFERILAKRDGGGTAYDFYLTSTLNNIAYFNGSVNYQLALPTNASPNPSTIIWTHTNGAAAQVFYNGLQFSTFTGTSNIGSVAADIVVGDIYSIGSQLKRPLLAAIMVNEELSSENVAQLHREVMVSNTIVHRPSKNFSIPYPSKTAAEYAEAGIIFDAELADKTSDNVLPAKIGTAGSVTGTNQIEIGGPFNSAFTVKNGFANFGTTQGNPSPGNGSFLCEAWVYDNRTTDSFLFGKYSGVPLWYVRVNAGKYNIRIRNALSDINVGSTESIQPKWSHVALRIDRTNSLMNLFVDGLPIDSPTDISSLSTGTMDNPNLFVFGNNQSSIIPLDGKLVGGRFTNRLVSDEEIRNNYLLGARKCLLDARIHADGSAPVSLEDVTVDNELANGWKLQLAAAAIKEEDPSGTKAGDRYINVESATMVVSRPCQSAFGSWWFKYRRTSACTDAIVFIASKAGLSSDSEQNGYSIELFSGRVGIVRITGGSIVSDPLRSSNGLLEVDISYELWVTRKADGVFTVWVKGGDFEDWTLVNSDVSGSNPTAADTTYIDCSHVVLQSNLNENRFYGMMHFLGEMTPTEAVSFGILQ